jgi:hypothetical protein
MAAGWSPRPGHQCAVLAARIVCFGGFGLPFNPMDVSSSTDGRVWATDRGTAWDVTSPDAVKYDVAAVSVPASRGGHPAILTFGGDRATFDPFDPVNWLRVDSDVWRVEARR